MKTLASLSASGIGFTTPEHRFLDFEPPMERIVAKLSSPNPCSIMTLSLPLTQDAHEEQIGRRAVSIGSNVDGDTGELSGLLVRMHGIALVFNIDLPDDGALPEMEIARPDMIDLIGMDRTSRIFLPRAQRRREAWIVQIRFSHRVRIDPLDGPIAPESAAPAEDRTPPVQSLTEHFSEIARTLGTTYS